VRIVLQNLIALPAFGRGCSVPEALFVPVLVGTEVIRVVGLLAIAVIVGILTTVLAVLQALLKVRFVSNFIVVAVSVLVAILVLRRGNRGSQTRRAESGEGDSKS